MSNTLIRIQRNNRNVCNLKGKYFLDKLDGIIHSTNNYTLWNFYHSLCYGKPFPGEIDYISIGPKTDWNVITFNDRVLMSFLPLVEVSSITGTIVPVNNNPVVNLPQGKKLED